MSTLQENIRTTLQTPRSNGIHVIWEYEVPYYQAKKILSNPDNEIMECSKYDNDDCRITWDLTNLTDEEHGIFEGQVTWALEDAGIEGFVFEYDDEDEVEDFDTTEDEETDEDWESDTENEVDTEAQETNEVNETPKLIVGYETGAKKAIDSNKVVEVDAEAQETPKISWGLLNFTPTAKAAEVKPEPTLQPTYYIEELYVPNIHTNKGIIETISNPAEGEFISSQEVVLKDYPIDKYENDSFFRFSLVSGNFVKILVKTPLNFDVDCNVNTLYSNGSIVKRTKLEELTLTSKPTWKSTDWTQITGIGAVKNKAIIAMINDLDSVDDLIKVNGIGIKTLKKIKDFLGK